MLLHHIRLLLNNSRSFCYIFQELQQHRMSISLGNRNKYPSDLTSQLISHFQPFDAMMRQLNLTVNRLQWAAQNVSHGLAPLNYGLEDSEISLLTGKRELTETEKVIIV